MTDKVGQLTDYKAIADRLVERGIARKGRLSQSYYLHEWDDVALGLYEEKFCHDWRVAGACMERLDAIECATIPANRWQVMCAAPGECYDTSRYVHNKSPHLAIILAYLEATDE